MVTLVRMLRSSSTKAIVCFILLPLSDTRHRGATDCHHMPGDCGALRMAG
jgi:hypothetical protein